MKQKKMYLNAAGVAKSSRLSAALDKIQGSLSAAGNVLETADNSLESISSISSTISNFGKRPPKDEKDKKDKDGGFSFWLIAAAGAALLFSPKLLGK